MKSYLTVPIDEFSLILKWATVAPTDEECWHRLTVAAGAYGPVVNHKVRVFVGILTEEIPKPSVAVEGERDAKN